MTFRSKASKYGYDVLKTLSILLNVLLGGEPHQMFSARNYQWKREGRHNAVYLIDGLLGHDHCLECWINWVLIRDTLKKNGML